MIGVASTSSQPYMPFGPRFADELAEGEPEGNPCGLGLDIDEAAHAGFALTKNGGLGAFSDHAHHQMNLAMNHHFVGAMGFEPLVKGGAGLCGTLAGAAVVGPAAGFAMHAGWHEWKEAAENAKKFEARERNLINEASFTHKLSTKSRKDLGSLTQSFDAAAALRITDNKNFATASKSGGLIGKYSFLSGAAIMARIAVELIRNVGGSAASGTTHVASAAATGALSPSFLMGTGLASNAFASLASGFAVMLGVNFVRKTGATRKTWQADAPELAIRRHLLNNSESAYGKFLEAKSKHRIQFINSFHWKNKMFLAGAGLYAAGTILPSCIKMLAAAGILSSKKVGAKIILALFVTGISGAIIMGIFSHQFFYGHPNLERYDQYGLKDTKELDRRFLTNIDAFFFKDEHGNELDSHYAISQGLAMRESAFNMLKKSEKIRESFLQTIARSTNRSYAHIAHVGDDDYPAHRPFITKVKTLLSRKGLRVRDAEQWLRDPKNKKQLLECFGEMLGEKIAFLKRKEALHKRMHDQLMGGAQSLSEIQERRQYGQAMFSSYDDSVALLEQHRELANKITNANSHADTIDALKAVLELQASDDKVDEKASFEHRLAKHLLLHLTAQYNHDRGMLLEIERQAGKRTVTKESTVKPFFFK